MKKIITYFLIISVVFLNFTKAQIDPTDLLKVPVIDAKAVSLLTEILGLLQEELKKLNIASLHILQAQFQQFSGEVAVDALKSQQYIEILSESEEMLKKRIEKRLTENEYKDALEEARIVGADMGLNTFIKNIGSCLNPRIREELTDYVMKISEDYKISQEAKELLDKIDDCSEEEETTMAIKPNFLAWLTQPFIPNLAQVSQEGDIEPPTIVITPSFRDVEDSIELSNLQALSYTLITGMAKKMEEKRKEEIGEIWPIEICDGKMKVDKDIDGGKAKCEKYRPLIEGKDIDRFREDLALNQSLTNALQNLTVYQFIGLPESLLNQTGSKIPSVEKPSDFGKTFSNEEEIKEVIDRICSHYKSGEERLDKAYALCLKHFAEQFKKVAKIQEEKLEFKKKQAEETKKKFEEAKGKAEGLKGQMGVCTGAREDLEEITQWLVFKIEILDKLIETLNKYIAELNRLIAEITSLLDKIVNFIDRILEIIATIKDSTFLNFFLSLLIKILTNLFGIDVEWLFNQIIKLLKEIRKLIAEDVRNVIDQFISLIKPFKEAISKYNELMYKLYKDELTSSSVLNDIYELNLILQRLDAYERAIAEGECSSGGSHSGVSLIKNQVIVVKSTKEQNRSFNFFALFKNMFEPKTVEIKNEK